MSKNKNKIKIKLMTLIIVIIMTIGVFLPLTNASNPNNKKIGYDKGPSSLPVAPIKEVTFVNHDVNSLLDDYAYLSSVSTAVFQDKSTLYSHPLLFYQDEYKSDEDKKKSLNPRLGVDYFMEDWMSYCNGKMDQLTTINIDRNKLNDNWDAKEIVEIKANNLYEVAKLIALKDWSYSDDIVIAVAEPSYEKPDVFSKGSIDGSLEANNLEHKHFSVDLPDIGTGGTWTDFEIKNEVYKYITMQLFWNYKVLDFDLQLYDKQLGLVDNAMRDFKDHLSEGSNEIVGSFIHNYGDWQMSVTAVPKKEILDNIDTDFSGENLKNIADMVKRKGDVDITMYPGSIVELPSVPFGCRNVDLKLKWDDPNTRLGFTVIDPAETEIMSSVSSTEIITEEVEFEKSGETNIHITQLGETREDENYKICVFSLDDMSKPVDFEIEYSWNQNFSKTEGDGLYSATNGAVLASKLNCPLLYTSSKKLSEDTKDVLYKLGVKKIHLVDLGDNIKKDVEEEITEIADKVTVYDNALEIFNKIKKDTDHNDVVFSTIDPWTYWYAAELEPAGEYPNARFIGPAAFTAAHHCTPVVLVDMHPRLSQAVTYHTNFWSSPHYAQHISIPNSGSMTLSSRQVYDFLEDFNLGKLEPGFAESQVQETIITVAGQYDIGIPWDRSFTGAGLNGRFLFSPVDTAYWISRNIFYPALIFQNPGMNEIELINGSESEIQPILGRLKKPYGIDLVITKPSGLEKFKYPVLSNFDDFIIDFNSKASKHWNFKYERADGITPGEEFSPDPIDDGVVEGKSGAYYPDLDETYVIPFYVRKAGYDNVYSSYYERIIENLNKGVLIWNIMSHGGHIKGGTLQFWDAKSPYVFEENPWRVYETPIAYAGNLRELIRYPFHELNVMNGRESSKLISEGLLNFHLLPRIGSTKNPDILHINPQLRIINSFLKKINFPIDLWGAFGVQLYRDRLLHPIETLQQDLPFVRFYEGDGKVIISPSSGSEHLKDWRTGYDFDEDLENVHSVGINSISCLPAGTFLHAAWVRHGTSYQIMDPWTTTDWSAVWEQMLIKRYAMGYTVGQAYERGMRAVGPEYTVGQVWWDRYQNVELFGDPDMRIFVPNTKYTDRQNGYEDNFWTKDETRPIMYDSELNINGHMPFGATSYPHERKQGIKIPIWLIVSLILVLIILAVAIIARRKK